MSIYAKEVRQIRNASGMAKVMICTSCRRVQMAMLKNGVLINYVLRKLANTISILFSNSNIYIILCVFL